MAALYLNSYPLTLSGEVSLFQMRDAAIDRTRDELRELTGVQVFVEDDHAYSYREPAGVAWEAISERLLPLDGLRFWVLRDVLIQHCHNLGLDAWFRFGGELHVVGLTPAVVEDRFRVEHVLQLRVSREEYADADALLTARHKTQWQTSDPISDPDIRGRAAGHPAVRLSGDGPRRGWVEEINDDQLVLGVGEGTVEVASVDYAMSVNASVVAGWRGLKVLRQLRVTTGELTVSGKRNQHGIADRFKLIGDAVRGLGTTITANGGAEIEISQHPVAIRLEGEQ